MRKWLLLCLLLSVAVTGCPKRDTAKDKISELELDRFVNLHLSDKESLGDISKSIDNVVKLGDKAVSRLMEIVGQAATPGRKVKRDDYWIIVALARIGSKKATDGIITILEHNYPGDIAADRQVAARALVALKAKMARGALKKAISEHQKWVDSQLQASGASPDSPEGKKYKRQIDNLNKFLKQLEAGEVPKGPKQFL